MSKSSTALMISFFFMGIVVFSSSFSKLYNVFNREEVQQVQETHKIQAVPIIPVEITKLPEIPEPIVLPEQTEKDMYCLAQNIYFEAKNQSLYGQMAVAMVTLNRVLSEKYPDTICEVVWQRKQFSWTHDGKSDKPKNQKAWETAIGVANITVTIYDDRKEDITNGALFYHAYYVSPSWSKVFVETAKIEDHIFYKEN